jgi:hypothetical protein
VKISAVNFNTQNIVLSEGLFLFRKNTNLFDNASEPPSSAVTREIAAEIDLEGRNEPPVEDFLQNVSAPLEPQVPNNFCFFTTLPLAFTVLERNDFILPPNITTGPVAQLRQFLQQRQTNTQQQSETITSVSTQDKFSLDPSIYTTAIGGIGSNEKVERHELVIAERKTDFFMDQYDTIGSVANAPFVFSFYENNTRYERCFVDAAYLAASIDAVLLQHVRKAHSMRIVYNSMEFVSYQKKVWYNTEKAFCKKVPLKCISTKSVSFYGPALYFRGIPWGER